MSSFNEKVLGIDFGTQTTRVALIAQHQRMPATIRNNFSLEATPSVVAFDEDKRYIGEEGLSKVTSRPKWAANLLRLHLQQGKTPDELGLLYKLEDNKLKTPRGEFDLMHLYSMLFNTVIGYARRTDGAEKGTLPAKIVVAIPKCSTHAVDIIVGALQICGMKSENVQVTTDGIAAAACYRGLRFETLPVSLDDAQNIAIVDIGHGYHTVTIAKIARNGLKIVAECSDNVGSVSIDNALLSEVLQYMNEKDKQDFADKTKQLARLVKEATKTKEMMSTVDKHTMNVEALTDTYDLKYKLSSDDIFKYSITLRDSITKTIATCISEANIEVNSIQEIQVIGGGWRTNALQDTLKNSLSTENLCVHLDPVQTVAQGCALIGTYQQPVPEEEKNEEINGVHFVEHDIKNLGDGSASPTEVIDNLRSKEQKIQEEEDVYNARMEIRNKLESYILSLPNIAVDAKLDEKEYETLEAKVKEIDSWLLSEEGEQAHSDVFVEKLQEAQTYVQQHHPKIAEYEEKMRLEDEEKDRKRAEQAKLAQDTKEPKTDPQRIKAAQERCDQGVVLFKEENYEDATTRFVQAIRHLKDIYDLEKDDNKKKRDEISLRCRLNIASASIKLKKYSIAVENCTRALDFDANSAKAYFRRGQALRLLTDFDKASEDLKKALDLSGGDVAIKKEIDLLAKQKAEQKKKDKAIFSKMFS